MRLLFVAHDCCEAGAQHSLLRILRWLRANTDWSLGLLALGDGPLAPVYAGVAPVLVLRPDALRALPPAQALERVAALTGGAPDVICGNTVIAPLAYGVLSGFGAPIATRIAELDDSIERYLSPPARELMLRHSSGFVAVSDPVAAMLACRLGIAPGRIAVINGAIEHTDTRLDAERRAELLERFGLAPRTPILWGCGSVSRRKGADLFLAVAEELLALGCRDFHAFWAGYPLDDLAVPLFLAKEQSPARAHVTFLGRQPEPNLLMAPGDVFLMTSREDPFPLVSLEAAERGLPSLCFPGCGGIEAFVADGGGLVAPGREPADMARLALPLLAEPARAERLGALARALVLSRHAMDTAGPKFVRAFTRLAQGEGLATPAKRSLADVLTVVIRGVGERTVGACRQLLRQAVPDENIIDISRAPFSAAIRAGFEAAIARGRKWTLVMDADVLVRADFPAEIVAFAEGQDASGDEGLFVAQGLVLDKFFGILRPAGNHLYRTSLLPVALSRIPAEGGTLRPESATIDSVLELGHRFVQTDIVAGLHDFEQHALDIAKKCFVQTHKHGAYVDKVWPFWEAAAATDPDFAAAMLGARAGRGHQGAVFIDSGFLKERVQSPLAESGMGPKPPLDARTVNEGYVQAALLAWKTDPCAAVMQPFMFPRERWNFVYGGKA